MRRWRGWIHDIDGEFSLSSRKFFLCNKGEKEKNEKEDKFLAFVVGNGGSSFFFLYLSSSGQCPSPAGFGLTCISLLLYHLAAQLRREDGRGQGDLGPQPAAPHPLISPLAASASGLGARVSGSQGIHIPSSVEVREEACGLQGAVLPWLSFCGSNANQELVSTPAACNSAALNLSLHPLPSHPEVQSGEEAGPAPGAGGEAAPPSTLMKSVLLLQYPSRLVGPHMPQLQHLCSPALLYPQAAPHLEVEGPVLSTPVHPQQPFCLQLRGVWSKGIWSEGSAKVKGCNFSRAPALLPPLAV